MASSAERVFATPELLETFLLEVTNIELNIAAAIGNRRFLTEPLFMKSVIGLQRVNSDFQNTIRGSSKLLKRRLEAANFPDVGIAHMDHKLFGPLFWFERQRPQQLGSYGVATLDTRMATITFSSTVVGGVQKWLSSAPKQSWRSIPCLTDSSRISGLQLKVFVSGFGLKIVGPLTMRTTATLGDLAKMLHDIILAEEPGQLEAFKRCHP